MIVTICKTQKYIILVPILGSKISDVRRHQSKKND
jgi:hypothetical protein